MRHVTHMNTYIGLMEVLVESEQVRMQMGEAGRQRMRHLCSLPRFGVCVFVRVCVFIRACVRVRVRAYMCAYVCVCGLGETGRQHMHCLCSLPHIGACVFVRACVRVRVHVYVFLYVYVCVVSRAGW